ncbi:MAG: serine kinase [Clostridia bacterium]|nr:serine kinase [Clostridia bacterium]
MTVRELAAVLSLEVKTASAGLDRTVTGGYCCDLLSYVMAKAPRGGVWITVQTHENIVAVAVLVELAAIIITEGKHPDPTTLARAEQEKIPLLLTSMSSFEVAGKLYRLLVEEGRID